MNEHVNSSVKLETYTCFKSIFEAEFYLCNVKYLKHRKALAKFRTSNHMLSYEIGRYFNIDREYRVCPYCKLFDETVIENECHMPLRCPLYTDLRSHYIDEKYCNRMT